MDGAYAHLAACYKRTTDHCIAELNGCLTPGAWLKSSCLAGCFFQESLNRVNPTKDIGDLAKKDQAKANDEIRQSEPPIGWPARAPLEVKTPLPGACKGIN